MRDRFDSDSIRSFLARAQRAPKLTREREQELVVAARQGGDAGAAAELIEANLRYVVAIAVSYRRYGLRLADLVSEGNVGLMTALAKFDPTREVRFVTYASYWIRAYILDHVMRSWSMVGVGAGPLRSKVFFRLRRERARIATETSDPVEANERLAKAFGTSPEKISELAQRIDVRDLSVDTPLYEDSGSTVLDAMSSDAPSQEAAFLAHEEQAQLQQTVQAALEDLDPRERYIVNARIMADDPDAMSLADIGRELGVSRERARQLEVRAKEKLKRRLSGFAAPAQANETEVIAAA